MKSQLAHCKDSAWVGGIMERIQALGALLMLECKHFSILDLTTSDKLNLR